MSRTLYRVTQENLIENSVQDCLSYILKPHGLCQLLLTYSKQPYQDQYVLNLLYDIIFSEPFISFYVICDHVTVTFLCDHLQQCDSDVMLTLTLSSKNREINEKKSKKENVK